jgi:fido (protein-threonine AMPylation protein)
VPTAWVQAPGSARLIEANVQRVLTEIAILSSERRPPTVARAQQWHRELYDGVDRPFDYYAGEVRDSDQRFPELIGYEVHVAGNPGMLSALVPAELDHFELGAQRACALLDTEIVPGADASMLTPRQLHGVLTLCAVLHGEWVRIHPFANGNGRTARVWANWAALRYELPPFVTIKPCPGQPYAAAALASMRADHQMMTAVFDQMLRTSLGALD